MNFARAKVNHVDFLMRSTSETSTSVQELKQYLLFELELKGKRKIHMVVVITEYKEENGSEFSVNAYKLPEDRDIQTKTSAFNDTDDDTDEEFEYNTDYDSDADTAYDSDADTAYNTDETADDSTDEAEEVDEDDEDEDTNDE